jgi:hypothetical protein
MNLSISVLNLIGFHVNYPNLSKVKVIENKSKCYLDQFIIIIKNAINIMPLYNQ